jgi:hypothetical protein
MLSTLVLTVESKNFAVLALGWLPDMLPWALWRSPHPLLKKVLHR